MTRFGVPGQNSAPLAYADSRMPVVPMVQAARSPTTNDKKYPIWTEWRVSKGASLPSQEGDFWKLIRFNSVGDAIWVKITEASTGPVITLSDTAGTKVESDTTGNIELEGTTDQIDIVADPGNNKLVFSIPNFINQTSWTPSVDGAVSGPPTIAIQAGRYARVGPIATLTLELSWTALNGASGDVIISGFPFTFNGSLSRNPLGTCWVETIAWPAARTQCLLWGIVGTTTAKIYVAGTSVSPTLLQIGANGTIHVNMTFSI